MDVLGGGKSKGSSKEHWKSREKTHDEENGTVDDVLVQAQGWFIYPLLTLPAGSAPDGLDVRWDSIFGPFLQTEARVRFETIDVVSVEASP